jgi:hypothetical protein
MHRESTRYRYSISEEHFYIGRRISVGWHEMDSVVGAKGLVPSKVCHLA